MLNGLLGTVLCIFPVGCPECSLGGIYPRGEKWSLAPACDQKKKGVEVEDEVMDVVNVVAEPLALLLDMLAVLVEWFARRCSNSQRGDPTTPEVVNIGSAL